MSTTFDRLSMILQQSFKVPAEKITTDATLASLDIDSLGTVELLWQVEEAFRITIPAPPKDLLTLSDVAQHIDQLIDQLAVRQDVPLTKAPAAATPADPRHAP